MIILDPIKRGKINREKAIQKLIKLGIEEGKLNIKEANKIGKNTVKIYDYYIDEYNNKYIFNRNETNRIKNAVHHYFTKECGYETVKELLWNGWITVIFLESEDK